MLCQYCFIPQMKVLIKLNTVFGSSCPALPISHDQSLRICPQSELLIDNGAVLSIIVLYQYPSRGQMESIILGLWS